MLLDLKEQFEPPPTFLTYWQYFWGVLKWEECVISVYFKCRLGKGLPELRSKSGPGNKPGGTKKKNKFYTFQVDFKNFWDFKPSCLTVLKTVTKNTFIK